LNGVLIDASIYHYGWVKEPAAMQRKQENFNKLWHDDQWINKNVLKADEFDYSREVSELRRFDGTHPEVMKERIERTNWKFDYDISHSKKSTKDILKSILKKIGIDTTYQNYKIVKPK
jgi:hypothetical protein